LQQITDKPARLTSISQFFRANRKALFWVMICTLTIVRYPRWLAWAGLLSMAVFRIPLATAGKLRFWKLLGCGRNGSFDIVPDLRQWAVLLVWDESVATHANPLPAFMRGWWRLFGCERCTISLQPVEAHGSWDGQHCFGELPRQAAGDGMVAVLTRASIRAGKLRRFWTHVASAAAPLTAAPGFISSVGIGEIPWIRQATFSIWENRESMKAYAYGSAAHTDVIRKTREEGWYSEEMFARFAILGVDGTIRGKSPLERKA
jgi:hypothetical protein